MTQAWGDAERVITVSTIAAVLSLAHNSSQSLESWTYTSPSCNLLLVMILIPHLSELLVTGLLAARGACTCMYQAIKQIVIRCRYDTASVLSEIAEASSDPDQPRRA